MDNNKKRAIASDLVDRLISSGSIQPDEREKAIEFAMKEISEQSKQKIRELINLTTDTAIIKSILDHRLRKKLPENGNNCVN